MPSKGEKGAPAVRIERTVYEDVMKQKEKASKSNDPTTRAAALSIQSWFSFLLVSGLTELKDGKSINKD